MAEKVIMGAKSEAPLLVGRNAVDGVAAAPSPARHGRRTEKMKALVKAFALAITAMLALPGGANSQTTYPDKPVRIICDSAPGSATDVVVRLLSARLSTIWGQQAIVDNRPGGGGSIAARAGQTATPDGYTLYVGNASIFTALKGAPGVAPNLPVELPRD